MARSSITRDISVLIATKPRLSSLLNTALPSIAGQTRKPDRVVVVSDQQTLSEREVVQVRSRLGNVDVIVLKNNYQPGAAGSWNSGIDYITEHVESGFVAILDDDDYWDDQHLALCEQHAHSAQLVVSGINVVDNANVVARNIPKQLITQNFLVGNPGWQGSNTFIDINLLNQAGRFTDGLISCNDRDLAIRVLDLLPKIEFTGQPTANWNINHSSDALSAARSAQKLAGVCQFYQIYHQRMSSTDKELFFSRVERLFKWTRSEIEKELEVRSE